MCIYVYLNEYVICVYIYTYIIDIYLSFLSNVILKSQRPNPQYGGAGSGDYIHIQDFIYTYNIYLNFYKDVVFTM